MVLRAVTPRLGPQFRIEPNPWDQAIKPGDFPGFLWGFQGEGGGGTTYFGALSKR